MTERLPHEIVSGGDVPPKWFWVASIIGLLWNLAGVAAFVEQMTMDPSFLSVAERAFHEATPVWATAAFATAVSGGVLGSVALLLRRYWAFPLFVVSLLGIAAQLSHSLFIGGGIEVFGPTSLIIPLLTFSIAIALAGFARHSAKCGWLK